MSAPPEEIDDADADAAELALRFSVDARHAGTRLDKALAELMPDVSRSRLQQWVADAAVRVNGATVRQRHELVLGDLIEIEPQPAPDAKAYAPEPMPLAIVHEDSDILVPRPATGAAPCSTDCSRIRRSSSTFRARASCIGWMPIRRD
jgi:23S rRNA pseudouridine1911/1915/1917 synthase